MYIFGRRNKTRRKRVAQGAPLLVHQNLEPVQGAKVWIQTQLNQTTQYACRIGVGILCKWSILCKVVSFDLYISVEPSIITVKPSSNRSREIWFSSMSSLLINENQPVFSSSVFHRVSVSQKSFALSKENFLKQLDFCWLIKTRVSNIVSTD